MSRLPVEIRRTWDSLPHFWRMLPKEFAGDTWHDMSPRTAKCVLKFWITFWGTSERQVANKQWNKMQNYSWMLLADLQLFLPIWRLSCDRLKNPAIVAQFIRSIVRYRQLGTAIFELLCLLTFYKLKRVKLLFYLYVLF